jgi:glycosyltransferase involved in cell wall biosynthesis
MKISLIVCTRNRAVHLEPTINSLLRMQTSEPWQLIIVNNGSTDNTALILEDLSRHDQEHIFVTTEQKLGVANAQNAGLKLATGEIIAFTDDDCYPEPDFLERVRDCFKEDPIDYLGCRVLLYDQQDAAITIQTRQDRLEISPYSYISAGLIHGAAFAFKRDALRAIGGFDPDCGPGSVMKSGNDINTLVRCSAMGLRGAYDPRPVVYHHHRRKPGPEIDQLLKRYDASRGAAYLVGITSPGTRSAYVWPVFRRIAGNLLKGHWATLFREVSGAYRFSRILKRRGLPS